ncbi:heme-binding protein [Lamprobacter modestohalophilus]|uniref:SOUL family heme-binding protein n=1 Tax=Lamprobacter modestohalophilus TaxID=1064514 RepID=UPI002ADEC97E|nr:heme-binding protein [Lamprobacter modestohalophilus]MEA1051669.1 heme-binding protein [Lamprobacter modestohalophilus]
MKLFIILLSGALLVGIIAMLVFVYVIQNVEQPDYQVVLQDGDFELRDYPPLVVAEVSGSGSRQQSLSSGFGPLARYIFAKERGGERIAMTAPVQQRALAADEKIAMTAPVTQTPTNDGSWTVQFIMPAEYELEDLPSPGNQQVRLDQIPARRVAAVRFSGRTNDQAIAEQQARLEAWMAERGLEPRGEPIYAYYNDPFTPGPLRRNEVMFEVSSP